MPSAVSSVKATLSRSIRAFGAVRSILPFGSIGAPLPCPTREGLPMGRPVVQRGGVEIRAVRPNEGVHFGIDAHLLKDRRIAQWSVQRSGEHRLEVDGLGSAVIEPDPQHLEADHLDTTDAMCVCVPR